MTSVAQPQVGHWLNLRHMGDASCGNDQVGDNSQRMEQTSCPGTISGCTAGTREMTMNYMDYTDDVCMYMFTNGQKSRIDVFAAGGKKAWPHHKLSFFIVHKTLASKQGAFFITGNQ